ncbi:zinc ribbon domain-containing protein [Pontibacter sp. JH31]|uniref:Zinc ribbon domain-containing protein n=1 Tax=Pontibacter aquaedesilientis TaxID=2766980 RepID=A0ABR7XL91_9BACT|nr:zinc ribbon domain-containing protein [Pontibacter aquaedesilientis]MBD1399048.1 zinc ribbon domain-containing protein [Pontibacter aquaedesilientis]
MTSINCPSCGSSIDSNVSFCPDCGTKINQSVSINQGLPSAAAKMNENNKWYDNKLLTHILLMFMFPVGLFALWKTKTIAKWWKITATCIVTLMVVIGFSSSEDENTDVNNVASTEEAKDVNQDPLNITSDSVNMLVGAKVPYDKWVYWGNPTTMEETNNNVWVAYLPQANISFVSNKSDDMIVYAAFGKESASSYLKKANEERNTNIESQFSAWNGSHRNLERAIKGAMNDPDSYEHVETKYWDMDNHIVVLTKYRGKNAFGGKVLGSVKARVSLDGDILEVIEQN